MSFWVRRLGTLKWRMILEVANGDFGLTLADDEGLSPGLYLIGTGAGSPGNMTVEGRRVAEACQLRFLEGYTSLLGDTGEETLRNIVGDFQIIRRPDVEAPEKIVDAARKHAVALLVVGDPMQATTHVDLLLRCRDEGVAISVHHAVSAVDLICAGLGLQSYRFGRQVTLTYSRHGHVPTSPLEMIAENMLLGLHTLVLFDLDPSGLGVDQPLPMTPIQALEVLEAMMESLREDPPPHLTEDEFDSPAQKVRRIAVRSLMENDIASLHGVLCSNMGGIGQSVSSGELRHICGDGGSGIHSLVLTGPLLGMERDALNGLHGADL